MQHAFVVPDHDWPALGYGIMTLLHDPERAAALGQGGKQWVSERVCPTFYTWRFDSSSAAHEAGLHPCCRDVRFHTSSETPCG
jgi:hypothetical protein